MLDYDKQKKLVVLMSIGIVLCIIVAIVVLIFIWMPEKENTEYKVGHVVQTNINQETVLKKYAKDIQNLIIKKDYNSLYNLISKDYITYTGMTKESLSEYLDERNVCEAGLELIQYTVNYVDGYNAVYDLNFKVANEVYSINIIVKEEAPERYTIAFDGFIDNTTNVYSSTVNSVTLNVLERTRYTTWVEYDIKLTNGYNRKITMNSMNNANPIFIMDGAGDVRKPSVSTVPIGQFTMSPNASLEYTLKFDIRDVAEYMSYNYWVITNVSFENIEGVKDLQYLLH